MSHNKCYIWLKMIFAYFDKWQIGGRKRKTKVNKKLLHSPLLLGTGDGPKLQCIHKRHQPFIGFFLNLLSVISALIIFLFVPPCLDHLHAYHDHIIFLEGKPMGFVTTA